MTPSLPALDPRRPCEQERKEALKASGRQVSEGNLTSRAKAVNPAGRGV